MTLKKFSRAGLLAFVGALLLGDRAERCRLTMRRLRRPPTPAPRRARQPRRRRQPRPPACDAKTLENCTPNSGDTAWMLTSMAIVLMMTIPGLALFYGGMVRKKNVGDTVMTSFAIICLVSILWLFFTYSLAFRAGTPFIGGLDRAFLQGIVSDIAKGIGNPNPLAPTIPETVYSMFQLTFAIITCALIAGSFAERMKFSAMLWFIGLWAIFVYSPIAHWVWGPDGVLNSANDAAWVKVLDFAGGTVVHVNSGTAGLMAALMLGKRKDTAPPHNMVYTLIGASLLWVGWFGFNAGSAVIRRNAGRHGDACHPPRYGDGRLHLDDCRVDHARQADRDRHLLRAPWPVSSPLRRPPALSDRWERSPSASPPASSAIGASPASSISSAMTTRSMRSASTRVGGATGAILTGVFAVAAYGGTAGMIEGNPGQVLNQIIGVGLVFAYDVVVTLIILKIVDMVIGLRVSEEVEREGLDLALARRESCSSLTECGRKPGKPYR